MCLEKGSHRGNLDNVKLFGKSNSDFFSLIKDSWVRRRPDCMFLNGKENKAKQGFFGVQQGKNCATSATKHSIII
jgi:hypothetical protein